MSRYITPEGEHAIRTFKYKGSNLSYSYNYLWSPIAEQVLKITPPTWAPNTLTVVGLLIHTVTTIILIMQGPFGSNAPSWSLWLHGIGLFLYQTLDNVDGKQARKLHNSTPLGMIMDHGCDALGLVCLATGMARIICLDNFDLILWVFTFGVTFGFYISAWCQYFSNGLMILGKVNAVDDGIPVIWMCAFVSAVLGQDFWKAEVAIFGGKYMVCECIAISVAFGGIIQVYSIISSAGHNFTKEVGKATFDLIHLVLVGGSVALITLYSDLSGQYMVALMISIGFTMARTISYTLLCSVTGAKFQQFHPSVLLFGLGFPIYILFGQSLLSSCIVVYGITGFIVLEYLHFVVTACRHIAQSLGISIFHVFDPKVKRH